MLWLQRPKTVRKMKAECHPEARSSVILHYVQDDKKNVIHSNDNLDHLTDLEKAAMVCHYNFQPLKIV